MPPDTPRYSGITPLGERLPALVERVVASFEQTPRIQRVDSDYLPSQEHTKEICDLLLELSYPGFFGRIDLSTENVLYHIGELLPRLHRKLAWEIEQCLCYTRECNVREAGDPPPEDYSGCRATAQSIALEMVECLPEVRETLALDVDAAFDGDPAATGAAEIILSYPGLLAITIYRYAHELHQRGVPLMPRIMTEYAHLRTGIDIHPGATIGKRFFIDHGTGVVIGETAVIGENCKIYQGVTLGALSFPKDERGRLIRGKKRHPTLGDNVTVYANAIILGSDTEIGADSVVGGSVFLTHSLDPDHQVTILPPELKFRQRKNPPQA